MEMRLIMTAFIVIFLGLTRGKPSYSEVQENLRDRFDSKNDAKNIENVRNILGQEAAREQQAFDKAKDELRPARQKSVHKKKDVDYQAAFKREANDERTAVDKAGYIGRDPATVTKKELMGSRQSRVQATLARLGYQHWDKLSDSEKAMAFSSLAEQHNTNQEYTSSLEVLLKKFACARKLRFAVETCQNRYSVEAGEGKVEAENAIKLYFDYQDRRQSMLSSIVEELSKATKLTDETLAFDKVTSQWLRLQALVPNFDSESEDTGGEVSLVPAIRRLWAAKTEDQGVVVWRQDEQVWSERVYEKRITTTTDQPQETSNAGSADPSSSRSEKPTSTIKGKKDPGTPKPTKMPNEPKSMPMTSAQKVGGVSEVVSILLEGDSKAIRELSSISELVLDQQTLQSKESFSTHADGYRYMKNIKYLFPGNVNQPASEQFLTCSWVMIQGEVTEDSGLSDLFSILQNKWKGVPFGSKVRRFCSKHEIFWSDISTLHSHVTLPVPDKCNPGESDHNEFLEQLGEFDDDDAKVVGDALLSAFRTSEAIKQKKVSSGGPST